MSNASPGRNSRRARTADTALARSLHRARHRRRRLGPPAAPPRLRVEQRGHVPEGGLIGRLRHERVVVAPHQHRAAGGPMRPAPAPHLIGGHPAAVAMVPLPPVPGAVPGARLVVDPAVQDVEAERRASPLRPGPSSAPRHASGDDSALIVVPLVLHTTQSTTLYRSDAAPPEPGRAVGDRPWAASGRCSSRTSPSDRSSTWSARRPTWASRARRSACCRRSCRPPRRRPRPS